MLFRRQCTIVILVVLCVSCFSFFRSYAQSARAEILNLCEAFEVIQAYDDSSKSTELLALEFRFVITYNNGGDVRDMLGELVESELADSTPYYAALIYRGCVNADIGETADALADFELFLEQSEPDNFLRDDVEKMISDILADETSVLNVLPDADEFEIVNTLFADRTINRVRRLLFRGETFTLRKDESTYILDTRSSTRNYIVGARVSFVPDGEIASCTVYSSIQFSTDRPSSGIVNSLVSFDEEEIIQATEVIDMGEFAQSEISPVRLGVVPGQSFLMVVIVLNNKATVYVNNRRTIEDFTVSAKAGYFGVLLVNNEDSVCSVNDMFAYELESTSRPPDTDCVITSTTSVNRRAQATTASASMGQLRPGVNAIALAQTISDGFVWWQLVDDSWVRDDVVTASESCDSLTIIS